MSVTSGGGRVVRGLAGVRVGAGALGVRPQPEEEPGAEELVSGILYSADLVATVEEAWALEVGGPFGGDVGTGVSDPELLPADTQVMTTIRGASWPVGSPMPVTRPVGGGHLYTVVSVEPDPMDPSMVRVVLDHVL